MNAAEIWEKALSKKPRTLGQFVPEVSSIDKSQQGEVCSARKFEYRLTREPQGRAKAFEMHAGDHRVQEGYRLCRGQWEHHQEIREKKLEGHTDSGDGLSMQVQRANTKKVLGSVRNMNMGGNVVALEWDKSYMENKGTGQKTRIKHEGSQYAVHVEVPSVKKEAPGEQEKILKGNRFAILAAESEEQAFDLQGRHP